MIEYLLTLSTAHLSEETCNQYLRTAPFAAFEKGEYGWFVYVPDDRPDNLPTELSAIFDKSRTFGFRWVMFDRDASQVNEFQLFDW